MVELILNFQKRWTYIGYNTDISFDHNFNFNLRVSL